MHVDVYFEKDTCVLRRIAQRDPKDAAARAAGAARATASKVLESTSGVLLQPYHAWIDARPALEAAGLTIHSVGLVEDPRNAPRIDDTPF